MARKRDTGDGDEYTPAEEAEVADVIEDAFEEWDEEDDPTGADVEAEIEWAGTVDQNGRGGVRFTRLDGLDTGPVREAAREAERARRHADRELSTYRAKGWEAQWRQITASNRGTEAMAAAGLNVSRQTMLRWLADEQTPSKANQEKIARAYDELRHPGRAPARDAERNLAERLTEAVRERYGVTVRFRDIRSWRWTS